MKANEISGSYSEIFSADDSNAVDRMAVLAAKIAFFNFEWRHITLVLFSIFQSKAINSFLMNYNNTVALNTEQYEISYRSQIPQFVIFCENLSQVFNAVDMLVENKHDYNGKFIIICAQDNDKCDEEQIFKHLMTLYIVNVIYLKPSINQEDPLVYSYQIVRPGSCLNNEPEMLDVNVNCENNACFTNLFPDKLSNFYGCPLFITSIPQEPFMYIDKENKTVSGKDGNLVKIIVDVLNASLVVMTPKELEWGKQKNNNWTGCLGDVFNNRVHFAMCNIPLTAYLSESFQVSYPYYFVEIVWTAKVPPLAPSWEKLLLPFDFNLRITIILIFGSIIVLNILGKTKIWNKIKRALYLKKTKRSYLFYAWLLFLGLPLENIPQRKPLQIIILSWIWFSFFTRCSYQVTLIRSLKSINYRYNDFSYGKVLKYSFGGIESLKEYFIEDKDYYDNWVTVDMQQVNNILDDIMDEKSDFVLALSRDAARYRLSKQNGTKLMQIFNNCIVNNPIVVYLKKYSPLTDQITKVLNTAFEGGFVHYSYQKNVKRQEHYLNMDHIYNLKPLTLDHVAGCFMLLIVGWIIATIYFVLEVLCGKLL